MARATASIAPTTGDDLLTDEWELDTTITHSPTPLIDMCGTGDGCAATCNSACASV